MLVGWARQQTSRQLTITGTMEHRDAHRAPVPGVHQRLAVAVDAVGCRGLDGALRSGPAAGALDGARLPEPLALFCSTS